MLDEILGVIKQFQSEEAEFLQSDRPTLTLGEAAEVFGFSYSTIRRRLEVGRYKNIRKARTRRGWILDMEDVFQVAYPSASKDQIAVLMRDHRVEKRRRREKRWLVG